MTLCVPSLLKLVFVVAKVILPPVDSRLPTLLTSVEVEVLTLHEKPDVVLLVEFVERIL